MLFNSFGFAAFVMVVLAGTAMTPSRWRWLVLLISSYVFYASFRVPYLVAALVLVTGVSYGCGLAMGQRANARRRQVLVWLGISANVLTLVVLKYSGFLAVNLAVLLHRVGVHAHLGAVGPFASIGVSFFVFQGISYLADVYLETAPVERHLGFFALHMALFSKITQGPIERASALLPQLRGPLQPTAANAGAGLNLIFWGLFKKVVVADRLGVFVGAVYSNVHAHKGMPLILATYLFAFQLYFDFSGYTDMARGTARLFGIDLVENFNRPYFATSVAAFWRRWHMSFTSWILQYIFKPLQLDLRRLRTWGTPISLVVTFLVSGLWHGASWCFVIWGGLHGLFMATSVLTGKWRSKFIIGLGWDRAKWLGPVRVALTFHLVCFAWVFFRASTLSDAIYVVQASVTGLPSSLASILGGRDVSRLLWLGQSSADLLLAVALLAFMAVVGVYRHRTSCGTEAGRAVSPIVKGLIYAAMIELLCQTSQNVTPFIYFDF